MRRVARHAPAKVNLFLHIVGRRGDGLHLLESLLAFTDVGDELAAEPATKLLLELKGPFAAALNEAGPPETNLVVRAAQSLQESAQVTEGARLTLDKKLPLASGIGGGSSDAAAALHVLNRLWRLKLSEAELAERSVKLGADVPACVYARPAFVSGVGESVEPCARLPSLFLVLVNPGVGLPTADVYRAYAASGVRPTGLAPLRPKDPWTDEEALIAMLNATRNDLEAPAIALCPKIAEALQALRAQARCALARMSGSGTTCFGLFRDRAKALLAARAIAQAEPAWWVKPAHILSPEAQQDHDG